MIWEFVLGQLVKLAEWVGGKLAELVPDPPSWIAEGVGAMQTMVGYAASLSAWVPWGVVSAVVLAVTAVWVAALAVQVVRIVASFVTLGGGAT